LTAAKKKGQTTTVADFCRVMNEIAPTALAQEWDNVGLLVGDPAATVHRVLLCIDLTPEVAAEAAKKKVDLVMAYHPPIFKPIATLRADSSGTDAAVFACITDGIAIYSTHTALDAADGGTNDVIAGLCGIKKTEPLEFVSAPSQRTSKIVVFVPPAEVETVADAMFEAGAGHIGDYSKCSYRLAGQGSFLGGDSTNPTIGERGRLAFVDEVRLEMVVPNAALPSVVAAMIRSHSYEAPAYDIYPLSPPPARGIGGVGNLPNAIALKKLAQTLKRKTCANCVQIIGDTETEVSRAVIVVGAAGSLPFKAGVGPGDVSITGELRHHDALTIRRHECTAIALGHWASERPTLSVLAERLKTSPGGMNIALSDRDIDPFATA